MNTVLIVVVLATVWIAPHASEEQALRISLILIVMAVLMALIAILKGGAA